MNNKVVNILILLALVLFISFRLTTACNQLDQPEPESESIEELPVTYSGTIPCADCPGIDYYLHLEEKQFREVSWYLDPETDPFVADGKWFLKNDTLTLFDDNDIAFKSFLYSNEQLILLDTEGSKITGELADNYVLEKSQEETSIRQHHNRLNEEGVTFVSNGNEPFWSVQIFEENKLKFQTPEANWTASISNIKQNRDEQIYQAEADTGSLKIFIRDEYCRDSMSGFLFTHTVSVQVNNDTEMNGCGRFLE
ncbi:MAG: copper resistance protein NlpE N-terminal domain-containing protein [Balneolaceae bacterium]